MKFWVASHSSKELDQQPGWENLQVPVVVKDPVTGGHQSQAFLEISEILLWENAKCCLLDSSLL